MADDENAVQIDFAVQRVRRGIIPGPELFEVFEVNDRSAVVLSEVGSVKEIHSDWCRDDPMRRQQSAQIQISRCGILERVVIAVREHCEREGTSALGYANMSIERRVGVAKWPRSGGSEVCKGRDIDSARDVRRIRRVVDRILG